MKAWVLSYPLSAQRRLWSDWADAQADLSLRCPHSHFVGFVMSWLKFSKLHHHFNGYHYSREKVVLYDMRHRTLQRTLRDAKRVSALTASFQVYKRAVLAKLSQRAFSYFYMPYRLGSGLDFSLNTSFTRVYSNRLQINSQWNDTKHQRVT